MTAPDKKGLHPIQSKEKLTFSQMCADSLTGFCGSWTFILLLSVFGAFWIGINAFAWLSHWDPYPFILLNLVLSCLAAYEAPVILMSQNREAERDRVNARYDYMVNRKAEREIEAVQRDLAEIKKMIRKIRR